MPSSIKQYIQIAGEYYTTYTLLKKLNERGVKVYNKNLSLLKNEYEDYCSQNVEPQLNSASTKEIEWNNEIKTLADALVDKVIYDLNNLYNFDLIKIKTYNSGASHLVTDKEDLCIEIYDNRDNKLIDTYKCSLKLYEKISKTVQLASGTYVSTVCGLAFDTNGVGRYVAPDGVNFTSRNFDHLVKQWIKTYGPDVSDLLYQMKGLDDIIKPVQLKKYMGDLKWKELCYSVGEVGAKCFEQIMRIVYDKNPQNFRNRFLERIGFTGKDEILIAGYNSGKFFIFSTIGNNDAKDRIEELQSEDNEYIFSSAVGKQGGHSFNLIIEYKGKTLLETKTPFTINKNGCWWSKRSVNHKKNINNLPVGSPREDKQEIATSTNCYVNIGKIIDG